MPKDYSVADARDSLPHILDQVVAGVDIHITRRGRPIAVVMSKQRYEALAGTRVRFDAAYREFLSTHATDGLGLPARFFDGLRDRRAGRRVRL